MTNQSQRLASLDILRGLDLWLLVFVQPVLVAIKRVYSAPWYDALMYQLDHEVWEGFRCWDLVMPLFLFMVGAAMPFSFAKYHNSPDSRLPLVKRIARRVIILFLLGMIVQGNLLGFDLKHLYIYNNTLQSIAVGYLIASIILLGCKCLKERIIATAVLLAVYSIPMALWGDWSLEGNFAAMIDRVVIGRFRGDLSYTWIWSSLTFGVTVMVGTFAGELMRNARGISRPRIAALLSLIGLGLVVAGWLTSFVEPMIKRLWTSSMTIYSGGICMLLMALTYWIVDVKGFTRGLLWLKIYGMNPITAYCLGEVINFRSIVNSLSYGLQPILGDWYGVWLTFGNFFILFVILTLMYRQRVFLKI